MLFRYSLFAIVMILTGCTYFQQADDRRAVEKACGVDMLRDPTLKQLYCMEEVGKSYPNYQSLAHKIEEKKKEEANGMKSQLEACELIDLTDTGGVVEAPRTHPIPIIKEKARRYCEKQNLTKFQITNIQVVKKVMPQSTEANTKTDFEEPPKHTEVYIQKAQFECS